MKTSVVAVLLIISFLIPACGRSPVAPADPTETQLSTFSQVCNGEYSTNQFSWGVWEGTISADLSSIELIPTRSGALADHYNVLRWLEYGPCYDCVQVIDKQIIDANRVNLTIQIQHPFPSLPQFTGFDVYGGIQFPRSRFVTHDWPYFGEHVLAWRYDGVAQVLNPQGYDTGYTQEKDPPYRGFIPGKLGGEIVDPILDLESLIWPYRIFRTTPVRNMFEVWETASQTYELWLPEGEEVKFGYVVTTKWVPPDTMPVTDPATQFPREANMGIYGFEVLETTGPASYTQDATVRFRIYYHSSKDLCPNSKIDFFYEYWQYFNNGGVRWKSTELISQNDAEGVDECILTFERTPDGPDKGPPGLYPYLINPRIANCNAVHPNNGWFVFEIEAAD